MALDEDTVRLAKGKNLARDPRITVLIQSNDDPWDWSEMRGRVVRTLTGAEARQHIDEVSQRYTGHSYQPPVGPRPVSARMFSAGSRAR